MESNILNCRNCGNQVSGSYCDNSGQRASIYKITFIKTNQDFVDAVFSVDAPFFVIVKWRVLLKLIIIFIMGFISYGLTAFGISFLIIYLKQI